MKEQKDVRQRIAEGEFAQSAEISASYLDEDILIIDNLKVLQNPDPVRLKMNMIASCLRGSLKVDLNGREVLVEKGDIFISPPNSMLDIIEVSADFLCTAMCVSNHGMLNILQSNPDTVKFTKKLAAQIEQRIMMDALTGKGRQEVEDLNW